MAEYRIHRKEALSIAQAIRLWMKSEHLGATFNTRRIFNAWDQVSGAAEYTLKRYFRDGTLHITLSSSVVRSQLSFQKEALIEKLNRTLEQDELFDPENQTVSRVRELKLK
ncbi:MAG: DUF721 domain-containing protein [Bacteroidales bacterium]|nr:DUF721 domain-containing protein [Bacteroidales bacterium]